MPGRQSPFEHARQANEIPPALKARVRGTRDSKAQGEGREAAEALGWSDLGKALKGRHRLSASPLQGSSPSRSLNPGFRSTLPRAPPPWALLRRAFGAEVRFHLENTA